MSNCAPGCPGRGTPPGTPKCWCIFWPGQGRACLERLVGMFAFAAWDTRAQSLLLARDRLGIKPLYYRLLPDGIAFASELKALLVLDDHREVDQGAVRDFLFHGYIPAPKTIYRGIAKLPAGHTLTWEAGRIRIERYWNPSTSIVSAQRRGHRGGPRCLAAAGCPRAHLVRCSRRRVPERRNRFGAHYVLFGPAAHLHPWDSTGVRAPRRRRRAARPEHLHTEHLEMIAPMADFADALDRCPRCSMSPSATAPPGPIISLRNSPAAKSPWPCGDEIFCGYPRYWSRIGARSTFFNRALARCCRRCRAGVRPCSAMPMPACPPMPRRSAA